MTKLLLIPTIRSGILYATFTLGGTICNQAIAQVPAPFIGSWKTTWQADKKSYDAVMIVNEKGGTWQTYIRNQNNPCAGREVPMRVESSSPTEVKFELQFSEVIPGCKNTTVTLKASPDGAVTGLRSKFELTLAKQ